MILISACLLGIDCKYDGGNNLTEDLLLALENGKAIPICPEQLGGLKTPRTPAEIKGNKVITKDGNDVTFEFIKGVNEVVKIAKIVGCKTAILKERSPSCGSTFIYDGTHSGTLINGEGLLSKKLREMGIVVYSEENFPKSLFSEKI